MLDKLKDLASKGYSKTEAAKMLGVGRLRVHRLSKKHHVEFRRGSPNDASEVYDYRAEVRGMRPDEAVEYLLEVIEMAIPRRVDLNDVYALLPGISRQEARVLDVLMKSRDKVITNDAIWNAATFEQKRPGSRLISVLICSLRKKITAAGLKMQIVTVWGVGYRLEMTSD